MFDTLSDRLSSVFSKLTGRAYSPKLMLMMRSGKCEGRF
ncbi:MAG: hypothetical protein CM15mP111_0790 [Hyphomicrobiales bacterium]|nr:MAG: hypothetical protein CM15mP111_0790 [Hyphomicrobiales bacterium]